MKTACSRYWHSAHATALQRVCRGQTIQYTMTQRFHLTFQVMHQCDRTAAYEDAAVRDPREQHQQGGPARCRYTRALLASWPFDIDSPDMLSPFAFRQDVCNHSI